MLVLATLALLATPAQAAKKPDLVVTDANGVGPQYAFAGQASDTIFTFQTENQGFARAGPSVTKVSLWHADMQYMLGRADVDPLASGETWHGSEPDPGKRYNYPLGYYAVEVCADTTNGVRESDESNNCEFIDKPARFRRFYVVQRIWDGIVSGVAVLGGVTEHYQSRNARLVFDKPLDTDGRFAYDFAGTVVYKDTGGSDDCGYTGEGTRTFGPGGATADGDITLDYLHQKFAGSARVDDVFYKIRFKCGGSHTSYPGPYARTFFSGQSRFPFGATEISGNSSTSAQTWVWDLH